MRLKLEKALKNPEILHKMGKVYIWSGEHKEYWLPDGHGYTEARETAGIYDPENALERTKHCGPEKRIFFEDLAKKHFFDSENILCRRSGMFLHAACGYKLKAGDETTFFKFVPAIKDVTCKACLRCLAPFIEANQEKNKIKKPILDWVTKNKTELDRALRANKEIPASYKIKGSRFFDIWYASCWLEKYLDENGVPIEEIDKACFSVGQQSFVYDPYDVVAEYKKEFDKTGTLIIPDKKILAETLMKSLSK